MRLIAISALALTLNAMAYSEDHDDMKPVSLTITKCTIDKLDDNKLTITIDGTALAGAKTVDVAVNNDKSFDIASNNIEEPPTPAPSAMPEGYDKTQQIVTLTDKPTPFHVAIGGPLSIRWMKIKDAGLQKFDIAVCMRRWNVDHYDILSAPVLVSITLGADGKYVATAPVGK
jgi:hypothetical protein